MSGVRVSAPGKVVLSGEYAVLDGARAIAMAVDRRAVVDVDPRGSALLRCRGLGGAPDTRLVDCVRELLPEGRLQGTVILDTRGFSDPQSGIKYGIGSSAALSVALVRAATAGDLRDDALISLARQAHDVFQGRAGSGVDVATSVRGGLVEYRKGEAPRRLRWPDGLHFALLWSGVAASTADKLGRLGGSAGTDSRAALRDASSRLAACWSGADAAALVREYRRYVQALRRFDLDHDLGIFDAGHDALVRKADGPDIVYKPCGAGGGDIGIVLGVGRRAVRAFAERAASHGFRQLNMNLDPVGVLLTRGGE